MQRVVILLLVSVVIFEARATAAVPMVVAAAAGLLVSLRMPARAAVSLHPLRLLAFAPWFLLHSALGGVDVALRAFRGRGALRPGFVDFTTRIRTPVARVIFANTVSLMPGTLTARLVGAELVVHTLAGDDDVSARLREVERRVARAFGEELA